MNLSAIKAGDVLKCDVKGRMFYALATNAPDAEGIDIHPITRETYTRVTARQVTEHFRKMGRPRAKAAG